MRAGNSLLGGLLAFAVWGQSSEKVFYLAHLETPQAIQDVYNGVRSIGDIRDVSVDMAKRSLTVKGTADQLAIAAWMTTELDRTDGAPGPRDFPFNDPRAPLAQIIYLRHVDNARDLQEIVNALRSILEIQRFLPLTEQKAIVMRGFPEQVKAADWLLGIIDQPVGAQTGSSGPRQYRLPPEDWDSRSGLVIEVTTATHADTLTARQDLLNVTRSMTGIQRLFPIVSRRFLTMRGSEDQIAAANWFLQEN